MNDVILSADRRHMTVVSPDGQKRATLRSQLPDGFTAEHEMYARVEFTFLTEPGVHNCWRKTLFGRDVFVHVNTGPPTWWWPRVLLRGWKATGTTRHRIGVGWIRGLVEVAW